MKYEKCKDGSYMHNCLVIRRDDDLSEQLFKVTESTISTFLNGYAIIPIGVYASLIEMASSYNAKLSPVVFSNESIKVADEELNETISWKKGEALVNIEKVKGAVPIKLKTITEAIKGYYG